ncbi:hypothetical protein BDA96_04G175600 [Sorghum bicolor]|uniref:Uncharacterized protein n=1 Tax=Sorghum bicolor TaxID=4558 RepID=A0A921R555_SORBI|nr:hypothetical protein BDA96_04G175600 [Sorghum bicolor]
MTTHISDDNGKLMDYSNELDQDLAIRCNYCCMNVFLLYLRGCPPAGIYPLCHRILGDMDIKEH